MKTIELKISLGRWMIRAPRANSFEPLPFLASVPFSEVGAEIINLYSGVVPIDMSRTEPTVFPSLPAESAVLVPLERAS